MANIFKKPRDTALDRQMLDRVKNDSITQNSNIETLLIHKSRIKPDPDQPRKNITEESIEEKRQTLSKNGQESPITVLPPTEAEDGEFEYHLVDGECRWRASLLLEDFEYLRAEIYTGDPNDKYGILLSQLLHNDDGATPITNFERASAWSILVKIKEDEGSNSPIVDVAQDLGKSHTVVSQIIKFGEVSDSIKEFALLNGVDDPKAINSIRQIEKHSDGEMLSKVLADLAKAKTDGSNIRDLAANLAADVKATKGKKTKKKKGKAKTKKSQQFAVSGIDLKHNNDGSAMLVLDTPRATLKFKLTKENLAELQN